MRGKGGIIIGIISLVIGGTVYSVNKSDIIKNFSRDTGLSQEQSQQYIDSVKKEDLVSYDKIGEDLISDGRDVLRAVEGIDCINKEYTWESKTLTCFEAKTDLSSLGNDEIALGKAYIVLSSETATKNDISVVINLIEKNNSDFNSEIVTEMLDPNLISEIRNTNSFNKALLQSALDSKR